MKPVIYTVNGTACGAWDAPGFSSDVGRAFAFNPWDGIAAGLNGLRCSKPPVRWQGVSYPGATYPMGPSVDQGVAETVRLVNLTEPGTPIILSGYSQGAMVTGHAWRDELLSPAGRLHERLGDVIGIINFGDPLRSPGIANGNKVAGMPQPTKEDGQVTGGIGGPDDLKPDETPDFLLSNALDGDLYAACPVGLHPWDTETSVGRIETDIYQVVQQATFINVVEVAEALFTPVAMVEAIINGITFAAAGMNAPHWQYGPFVPAMVDWLLERVSIGRAA